MESLAEDAETVAAAAAGSEYEDLLQQYDRLVNSAEASVAAAFVSDRIPADNVDQLTHVLDDFQVCTQPFHAALFPVCIQGCRIGPLRFLARRRRRCLNQAFSWLFVLA